MVITTMDERGENGAVVLEFSALKCMFVFTELDAPIITFPCTCYNKSSTFLALWPGAGAPIPAGATHGPGEEEDLVSDTYTYTKDACMHSNTTSFVVNAFAAPHTIKVPIKGHYGFSTSSNHRESSSTAEHCGRADVSCAVIQRNSD